MKHYLTLILLVAVVACLSFNAGVWHRTAQAADDHKQLLREINFGHAISSAGEKFRVLQDLQAEEKARAMTRLSMLIDVDILEAARQRPPEFRFLEFAGNADWAAIKAVRNDLRLGHTDPKENQFIETELDWLAAGHLLLATPNHAH